MTKVIIVTGASQGFGKLISLTLAERGHQIVAQCEMLQAKIKKLLLS